MLNDLVYPEYAGRGLTLVDENNNDIHTQVLVVFKTAVDKEQRYIALLEILDNEVSNNLMIYRFSEENNVPNLEPIGSNEEYTEISDFLNNYINELESNNDDHECGCGCGCHDDEDDDCGCGCSCH